MNEKTKIGGAKKCANPHIFCAISHTHYNGNVKNTRCVGMWVLKIRYKNRSSIVTSFCIIPEWMFGDKYTENGVIFHGISFFLMDSVKYNAILYKSTSFLLCFNPSPPSPVISHKILSRVRTPDFAWCWCFSTGLPPTNASGGGQRWLG